MVSVSKAKLSLNYPPGPKGHFLWGILPDYKRDPIGFISKCAKEYGDVVFWKTLLFKAYQLNHPDYIEEVLVKKSSMFSKHPTLHILRRMLGNGLLTNEGESWQYQRRLIQPAFHRERICSHGDVMVEYTNRLLTTWRDGEMRDVQEDMMRLTLEIVAKTLFDAEVTTEVEEVGDAMKKSIEYFDSRNTNVLLYLIPDWVPTFYNLRFQKVVRQLDKVIYSIIQQRQKNTKDTNDLLSMLLQAQDENANGMSNQQLRDEVMTLFIGGHETTALVLSWGWYLLSQHPGVETKLVEELQVVLGDRTPTVADLPQLRYTERIVMEVMRLYPPVWALSRKVLHDCEIAGYPMRRGDSIVMSLWVIHRDPRFFNEPEMFNPDRWEGDLAKRLPRFAYLPFGGGPRICIGTSFAMMEAVLILATIAQKFRFKLVPGQTVIPWPAFTLRPKYGMKMLLVKR